MISALVAVLDHLPPQVQSAVSLAAGSDDPRVNEAARVALWKSIAGRDMDSVPAVLLVRLGICVLYPDAQVAETQDALEYFVCTFRLAGLPESPLEQVTALESYYGV